MMYPYFKIRCGVRIPQHLFCCYCCCCCCCCCFLVLMKNFPFLLKSFCLGNKAGYDTLLSSHMQHFLANLMLFSPLLQISGVSNTQALRIPREVDRTLVETFWTLFHHLLFNSTYARVTNNGHKIYVNKKQKYFYAF